MIKNFKKYITEKVDFSKYDFGDITNHIYQYLKDNLEVGSGIIIRWTTKELSEKGIYLNETGVLFALENGNSVDIEIDLNSTHPTVIHEVGEYLKKTLKEDFTVKLTWYGNGKLSFSFNIIPFHKRSIKTGLWDMKKENNHYLFGRYDFQKLISQILNFLSDRNISCSVGLYHDVEGFTYKGALSELEQGNTISMVLNLQAFKKMWSGDDNIYAITKEQLNDGIDELKKFIKNKLPDFNVKEKKHECNIVDGLSLAESKYKITYILDITPKNWIKRSKKTGLWDAKIKEKMTNFLPENVKFGRAKQFDTNHNIYNQYIKSGLPIQEFMDAYIKEEFYKEEINQINVIKSNIANDFQYLTKNYIWDKLVELTINKIEENPSLYSKYKKALKFLELDDKIPAWVKRGNKSGLLDIKT